MRVTIGLLWCRCSRRLDETSKKTIFPVLQALPLSLYFYFLILKVIEMIKSATAEEGVSVSELARKLKMPEKIVQYVFKQHACTFYWGGGGGGLTQLFQLRLSVKKARFRSSLEN